MFGLLNQDNMDQSVAEEFDRLERSVSSYLLTEHNEDGSHNMEPSGLGFVPIGSIIIWPIATAPSGWHVCNGSDINRTKYSKLFGVIGTTYGVGDGSTTYTLPLLAGVGTTYYIIFTGLGN
jgi:hypothetical protein